MREGPTRRKYKYCVPCRSVEPDVVTDSSEFAVPPDVRFTFDGSRVAIGPFPIVGETVAVRFTIPENPLTLETVRLAVAEDPARESWRSHWQQL